MLPSFITLHVHVFDYYDAKLQNLPRVLKRFCENVFYWSSETTEIRKMKTMAQMKIITLHWILTLNLEKASL